MVTGDACFGVFRELLGSRTKEKAGAPPVQGLLESMSTAAQKSDRKQVRASFHFVDFLFSLHLNRLH